jgi:glycine cleavage system pyridoxal-binding protein P
MNSPRSLTSMLQRIAMILDVSLTRTLLVIVQYPDSSGAPTITPVDRRCHAKGALVCAVANPTALALFKTPAPWA